MWVLAPTGEMLSFASPKESIQRKGDPVAAYFLRCYENFPWFSPYGPAFGCSNLLQANLSLSVGVGRRVIHDPLPPRGIHSAPLRVIPAESSGARRGKRDI